MNNEPDFARLLRNSLVATLCGATLILLSYFLVDRQVAFFVHRHQLSDSAILKCLTYPPPILQAWAPVALAGLMVRRVLGPFHRWECAMIAACLGMIVADQFRETLGFAFGRYWPETWIDDNPSLIGDGAYGFHPFHGGTAYSSFPSGHTARILAVATIVWIGYPRWRWACVLSSLAVAAGLIGMNYHFVGDVIAGGFVGGIVGAYIAIPAFNCMDGTRRAAKTSK
jgi:membrane-associated phospholipid phosphatase